MSKLEQLDIAFEIYELCQDLIQDISQQLTYFRASVYKNETADLIRQQIATLQELIAIIPNELMQEPFHDYEAEAVNLASAIPGECTFSSRVARLLQNLSKTLDEQKENHWDQTHWLHQHTQSFEQNVCKKRSQILSICRPGSRRWNFFQGLPS